MLPGVSGLVIMDDTVRILYLVDPLDDPAQDLLPHLKRLTRNLDASQFKVRMIFVRGNDPEYDSQSMRCPVEWIGMNGTGTLSELAARVKLYRMLRGLDDHLICAYGWAARTIGLPMARRVSTALRLSVVRDMGYGIGPRTWRMLQRVNPEVSRFIANSSAAATRLMRQENVARDRIDIIPGGVDWQRIPERTEESSANAKHSFGFSTRQPVILMTAPFTPTSDYATFLHAAKHLVSHHRDARFVLAGYGDESSVAGVKQLADELRIAENLVFVHDQVVQQQWIQAADVGVHASLLESCPDTLLTYMASGLPVVATRAGGAAEIISHGETGYLVSPREADALAMRIQILLVANNVASEFTAAARKRVQTEFSVQREVQSFADYYRTLAYFSSIEWLRGSGSVLA